MTTPPEEAGASGPGLDEAVLSALFTQSPVGLQVYDPQLRLVRVNTTTRFLSDRPVEELLGRPMTEVLDAFHVEDVDELIAATQQVLTTGTPVRERRVRLHDPDPEAPVRVASASSFRLEGADGTVLGVTAAIVDITERVRAEERLELLDRAANTVGTTLDLFRTAEQLGDVVVPQLADTFSVHVFDAVLRGEAPPSDTDLPTLALHRAVFRRAATRTQQPPRTTVTRNDAVGEYGVGSPFHRALTELHPVLIERLDPDEQPWLDPVHRRRDELLLASGAHSMMVVPLLARGVVLGLASFYRWRSPVPYDHDDLTLAEQLTSRTALSMDNARLYNRERWVAGVVQHTARDTGTYSQSAVEAAQAYRPPGASSVWFDVLPLSGARVALVAGEALAPTAHAAAALGELRAAVAALSELDLPPDELLTRLQDIVSRNTPGGGSAELAADPRRPVPAACLYAVYNPVTRRLRAASAGGPAPVVVTPDGAELLDVVPGPALGQGVGDYAVAFRTLPEGSLVVLRNGALAPPDQDDANAASPYADLLRPALADARLPLRDLCVTVLDALAPHATRESHPDAAVLIARPRALGPDRAVTWELPNSPRSVGEARELATEQLAAWGLAELVDDVALVVSELVTNAVRHADGPVLLRLIRDRALICEVSDDSSTAPHLRRALDTDEGGRGLFITAQLSERWGVRPARRGKTIWAELPLP
ncbi:SpoIIE family protein phosphatase [Streptacidiphilus fuscans]|uniref:SpoIIE family protein phosphatase n=1 Tax=Streptacidiphilus fuscans TaxID=2789292 RepID=A0A931B2Y5_9ACTN|nr:SpoIIE family protein phosphatase [Streptacidiphilus fuscans]MBF9069399.1 SpoIIE family protein phosphatase [Streptacidiphilus fuscans]